VLTSTLPAAFSTLPRTELAHLPTPLERLSRLTEALGGPELWIKRDDQTGLATGGNKARKLEFLIGAALAEGADCVITAGSTQSNHARQTAAAACKVGLEPHLVLYAQGGKAPESVNGNVLIDELLGACIHWTEEHAPYVNTIAAVEAELRTSGRKPHVVPYGGSNALGVMGYVTAMRELATQLDEREQPGFDAHIFATSSGATHAGMILGAKLAGVRGVIHGMSVDQKKSAFAPRIAELVRDGAALLSIDESVAPEDIIVDDAYLGGGYAVVGAPEKEAIHLLARTEGILVDPVYTGRALAGLIDRVRSGMFTSDQRILFWHTGGISALFAFSDILRTDTE
jgi:D-cysteine desulfhydrase